jgi:hypothetical protein
MSVRWNIDHAARQVEAIAEGSLSASDVLDYLEKIAEAGAMSYAKMFDRPLRRRRCRATSLRPLARGSESLLWRVVAQSDL